MNKEDLQKGNNLYTEIKRLESKVADLEDTKTFFKRNTDNFVLEQELSYYDHNNSGNNNKRVKKVKVTIPREAILKVLNHELYIANNLLKKHNLELEKL